MLSASLNKIFLSLSLSCPEKAMDLNADLFSGRYAYRVSLSLRIESHFQLPIAEVYSDKAAADVQLYSYWTICSKSENHRHITSNQHHVLNTG